MGQFVLRVIKLSCAPSSTKIKLSCAPSSRLLFQFVLKSILIWVSIDLILYNWVFNSIVPKDLFSFSLLLICTTEFTNFVSRYYRVWSCWVCYYPFVQLSFSAYLYNWVLPLFVQLSFWGSKSSMYNWVLPLFVQLSFFEVLKTLYPMIFS